MNIIGQIVKHKIWGKGEIIAVEHDGGNTRITVKFSIGEKQFVYPTCFEKYLIAIEPTFKIQVEQELSALANKVENECAQRETEREKRAVRNEQARLANTQRVYPRKNIAFKCSFCDGGSNENHIGFCNICSDENIKRNILKEKHTWCSTDSYCRMYLDGKLTREELQKKYDDDNASVCYESNLLRAWCYEAGFVVNGINKGKPNTLKQIQNNSLCVLTTQKSDSGSAERKIIGVFIVSRSEEGNEFSAGRVEAHSKYRLALTPKEASQMKFWNYHKNKSEKAPYKWGQGLFRYIDDSACIKILKDIVRLKQGTDDESLAVEILNYYCDINKLKKD
ncbi:MAG: hypothetical protein K2K04_04900 [Clostridia bacterium]|nr:hypothetical protein [Clostridia bacterium]